MRNENQALKLTSSVEPEAHDITRRVNFVPLKQLKTKF
jgi:hypothetical protein